MCAGALAQAGERGEEQEQTRQHPGRTASSSAGAGLCAAGRGFENCRLSPSPRDPAGAPPGGGASVRPALISRSSETSAV